MRQKACIAVTISVFAVLGLAVSGVGIYLFVKKDASYDKTITARIDNKRFVGSCIYEYSFKVGNATYRGSYVTNDYCISRDTVEIKYSSGDPSHNTATIFGSFPPRKLEGIEIAGCILLAVGGTLFIAMIIFAGSMWWCCRDPRHVKPSVV